MKVSRAKISYFMNVAIGIGFIVSLVSGLVLLFAGPSGGYQGGRNPRYLNSIAGLSREVWKDTHNWSSIIMAAGVLGHLILHWKWIVLMTRVLFRKKGSRKNKTEVCIAE